MVRKGSPVQFREEAQVQDVLAMSEKYLIEIASDAFNSDSHLGESHQN